MSRKASPSARSPPRSPGAGPAAQEPPPRRQPQDAQFDLAEIGDGKAQVQTAVRLFFDPLVDVPVLLAYPAGAVRGEAQDDLRPLRPLKDAEGAFDLTAPLGAGAEGKGLVEGVQSHHAGEVEFAPVAGGAAEGDEHPAPQVVLKVVRLDAADTLPGMARGVVVETDDTLLQEGVGDGAEDGGFGGGVAVPV